MVDVTTQQLGDEVRDLLSDPRFDQINAHGFCAMVDGMLTRYDKLSTDPFYGAVEDLRAVVGRSLDNPGASMNGFGIIMQAKTLLDGYIEVPDIL